MPALPAAPPSIPLIPPGQPGAGNPNCATPDCAQEIQDALRLKRYATALAKIADLQASLIQVDAWVQGQQERAP